MNAENEMVDPNRPYTVGCRLAHLVPDRTHAAAIEDAVTRVYAYVVTRPREHMCLANMTTTTE